MAGKSTHKALEAAETLLEEIANAVTHGIGAALSIAGLVVMIVLAAINGGTWEVVAVTLYGATLVLVFLSSTLYHGVWHQGAKRVFRAFDHCAIYLLIAGTYTPIGLLVLPQPLGWVLCATLWTLALVGVVLRLWLRRRHALSIPLYLAMGWLGVFWLGTLFDALGPAGSSLIVAGGLAYTGGLIFFAWRRLPFNHALWHLFVLAGSTCHFFAITLYVLPATA